MWPSPVGQNVASVGTRATQFASKNVGATAKVCETVSARTRTLNTPAIATSARIPRVSFVRIVSPQFETIAPPLTIAPPDTVPRPGMIDTPVPLRGAVTGQLASLQATLAVVVR